MELQTQLPRATTSLQGRAEAIDTPEKRAAAIEQAFDYRGDVTLHLCGGESIEGYVFNRKLDVPAPYLEIFPKGTGPSRQIPFSEVTGIQFSGTDTAAGRSWEAWQAKVAEAERNGTFAELYPESLDD